MIRPRDEDAPQPDGPTEPGGPEATADSILIRLTDFEGPMDLLLYLIQRDEIDVYDIPIAHITKQYLEYLDVLDVFSLDNAGEFLVMAATLMRIKARMLLPVQRPEEEDDGLDPRDELVRRLLEYKKYKEAAEKLAKSEETRRDFYGRGLEFAFVGEDEEPPEFSLTMFDLLGAVKNVLEQIQGEQTHHVYQEVWTVDAQSEIIRDLVAETERVRFEDVFREARAKMQVVVTFVAMLELLKHQELHAYQLEPYGEIWLAARTEKDPDDEPENSSAEDDPESPDADAPDAGDETPRAGDKEAADAA